MCASACSNRRLTSALTSSLSLSCDSSHSTRWSLAMCSWSLSRSLTSALRSCTRDSATSSRKDCNSSSKTRLRISISVCVCVRRNNSSRKSLTCLSNASFLVCNCARSFSNSVLFAAVSEAYCIFANRSCSLAILTSFSASAILSRSSSAIFWYMFRSSFASNKRPANNFFSCSSEARANRNDNRPTVLNLLVSYIVNNEKLLVTLLPPSSRAASDGSIVLFIFFSSGTVNTAKNAFFFPSVLLFTFCDFLELFLVVLRNNNTFSSAAVSSSSSSSSPFPSLSPISSSAIPSKHSLNKSIKCVGNWLKSTRMFCSLFKRKLNSSSFTSIE